MCTNSAILSAIARLPSIECSLQEATYLSKGKTVVCPVVPELASSYNWCGSQNLVVSVALSSSYVRFVRTSPVTQCSIFYRRLVCSSVSLFEGVFDITSTCFYGENSVDQSGAGYIIPIFTTEPCFLGSKQGLYSISYFLWGKTFDMRISYFPQGATSANHSRGLA